MNPFAEIEITPLFSRDGMASQGKSVRIATDITENPWEELGVVSSNYLLVHNSKVKDTVDLIAQRSNITDWKQRKMFFDGRRFVYAISSDNIVAEGAPGDLVRFGLIAYNSYDGSRALSVGAYAEHLVCSNGMTSEMFFSKFVFRHHQGNLDWDSQTSQAFAAVMPNSRAKLVSFANTLNKLKRRNLSMLDMKQLRKDYLAELSVSLWGKVVDRFLKHEQHNAFGILDACTNTFWHNDKETISDYRNNSYATDALVNFAHRLN